MSKAADTKKQKRNDFEARMNPALPDDKKRLIAKFEKLLTPKRAPCDWNSAILKCITITKEL